MAEHVKEIYGHISMDLSETTAFILSAGILSSVVLNIVRRLSESLFLGWPRYKGRHSINSLIYAQGRVLFYIVFVFFLVGVTGDNYSDNYSEPLDFIDVFFVSFSTFLYGMVINVIDDAVSAVYIFYRGE